MKRYAILLITLLTTGILNAQNNYHFRTDHPQGISVESSTANGLQLHYAISEIGIANIDNGEAKGHEIVLKGQFAPNAEGRPNLPVVSRYIAIPQGATVKFQVKENASTTLTGIDLLPAAPLQTDLDEGLPQLRWNSQVYEKDANFPAENVVLSTPTQIHSLDVVLLSITPFRYNPVQRTLEVIYDIDIDVRFEGGNGQFGESRYFNPDWEHILRNLVINGEMLPATNYYDYIGSVRDDDDPGCEYLIIAPDDANALAWADTLKNFRTRQGILTKVVRVSECGVNTATNVRNYILNAYNTWAIPPAAVLLFSGYNNALGIRPFYHHTITDEYSSQIYPTDYPYSDMNGDSLADIALSRVTAITAEEYRTFVEKTIQYESNPPMNDAYYDRPIISSGHEDNKWFMMSSQSINGFYRDKLGKNPIDHYMMVNAGTAPGPAWSTGYNSDVVLNYFGPNGQNYIPQQLNELHDWKDRNDNTPLLSALSEGAFLTLYRDHSNFNAWWCPNFYTDDVDAIVNEPPTFVLSISCSTALFDEYSNGLIDAFCLKPKGGAIGGIGATSLTYSLFNDILAWGIYDCIWPSFLPDMGGDTPPDFIRPSYILAEAKHYFAYHVFMPDWWTNREESTMHLFCYTGETYLNLYTETPRPLEIAHGIYHPVDQNEYTVTAEEGSVVCLSKDDVIIGVIQSDGQPCTFILPDMEEGEHFTLTATKQNRLRYEHDVPMISNIGPYVTIEDQGVLIENDFNVLHNGENAHFGLKVHNYGNDLAENTTMVLTCESPFIEITKSTCQYQNMGPNQAVTLHDAFRFNIADDTPDMTAVDFTIHIDDGNNEKEYPFVQYVAAPSFVIKPDIFFKDSNEQPILQINTEGVTDIHVQIANEGHFDSNPVNMQFEMLAPFITIDSSSRMFNSLEKGTVNDVTFRIDAHNDPIDEALLKAHITLNDGIHQAAMDTLLPFGGFNESFNPDHFSAHGWQMSGDAPWLLTSEGAYADEYSAQSGLITSDQTSSISITKTTKTTNISFFKKVSSELSYDKLHFFIDNEEKDYWSGSISWSKDTYPVTEGIHTFTWTYSKDQSVDFGDDCAWIDNFCIEPTSTPIAYSGDTLKACHDEEVHIDCGYAYNYHSLTWTNLGDGYFIDNQALHPVYVPGPQDHTNGGTTLQLNVDGDTHPLQLILTDEISLGDTIIGDHLIDPDETLFSHYSVDNQAGIDFIWELEPEEAGYVFAHENAVDIVWNFSHDITEAILTVSADASCSQSLSKTIQLDILSAKEQTTPSFTLYPNPTDGRVSLSFEEALQGKAVVEVFNLLGERMVLKNISQTPKGGTVSLDLSGFAPGLYIVKLNAKEGCFSKKVSLR